METDPRYQHRRVARIGSKKRGHRKATIMAGAMTKYQFKGTASTPLPQERSLLPLLRGRHGEPNIMKLSHKTAVVMQERAERSAADVAFDTVH